jgi:hypothetical protein
MRGAGWAGQGCEQWAPRSWACQGVGLFFSNDAKMHPNNLVFEIAEGEEYTLPELLANRPPHLSSPEDVEAFKAVRVRGGWRGGRARGPLAPAPVSASPRRGARAASARGDAAAPRRRACGRRPRQGGGKRLVDAGGAGAAGACMRGRGGGAPRARRRPRRTTPSAAAAVVADAPPSPPLP